MTIASGLMEIWFRLLPKLLILIFIPPSQFVAGTVIKGMQFKRHFAHFCFWLLPGETHLEGPEHILHNGAGKPYDLVFTE